MRTLSGFTVMLAVGCFALTLAPPSESADSGLIYGCVGRGGSLRVVSAPGSCSSKETSIFWNVTGPQGPTGSTGATGEKGETGSAGPGALIVVDSIGNTVGTLVEQELAVITVGAERFFAPLNASGFVGRTARYAYEGRDCTGNRYIVGTTSMFFQRLDIEGNTGHCADMNQSVTVTVQSSNEGVGGCYNLSVPSTMTRYVEKTVDLSAFVPPFHIK